MGKEKLASYYGDDFYQGQMDGSYKSASAYVAHLSRIFIPRSVVDLGCGRGTWLKAFKEAGAEKLVGYDGHWNKQENMLDRSIVFFTVDLNEPLPDRQERFDLAISLEVAEHLQESSAKTFVENLAKLSDVVLFGAAYTGQGGANHINERPHSYWAGLFAEFDFMPFDVFRPVFWGQSDIDFWYRQNTFLYVRRNAGLNETLAGFGHRPISNVAFMDCIHPDLYASKLLSVASYTALFRQLLRTAVPGRLVALARRVKSVLA